MLCYKPLCTLGAGNIGYLQLITLLSSVQEFQNLYCVFFYSSLNIFHCLMFQNRQEKYSAKYYASPDSNVEPI